MEPCPGISHLRLDDRSKAGIDRLRDIEQLGDVLAVGLGLNPLLDIFSKPLEISYNIATYDWGLWSAAMSAVPAIVRERVRQEAELQVIDHLDDTKQQQFWSAIEAGCRVPAQQPTQLPADPPEYRDTLEFDVAHEAPASRSRALRIHPPNRL